jgi:hypothetical protein
VVQDATAILNQAYDILSLTLQKNPTSSSCGPLSSSSSGHMVRIPVKKKLFAIFCWKNPAESEKS